MPFNLKKKRQNTKLKASNKRTKELLQKKKFWIIKLLSSWIKEKKGQTMKASITHILWRLFRVMKLFVRAISFLWEILSGESILKLKIIKNINSS